MKVLFDHQIFYAQRYGGISRYFRELAVRLASRPAMQVEVVAPFHRNEYLRQGGVFGPGWPYFDYSFRHADAIRRRARGFLLPRLYARRKADVVHETYFSEAAFGTGRARITTMYDMIHEIYPQDFPDAAQVTRAKRAAVDRCDHVICISEATRRDLVRLFDLAPQKTSVIHLGYDLIAGSDAEDASGASTSRPFLLFVGNRGHYKNFARLVEAFAASSTLRSSCDVVAFGGRPFNVDEMEQLQRLDVTARVRHMAGDDTALAECYRKAALFVFPSLYEGFGIPPLEAMSFGCPVACSNTSSIPEVVGDAAALFEPGSVDSIRETLEKVVGSETLRAELVGRGCQRLKRFSWDRCAEQTAALYADTLGKKE